MSIINRKTRFYFLSFLKHDFKASITVFFALPLYFGISLASGAPVYSGLLAGGLVISLISDFELSRLSNLIDGISFAPQILILPE
jgi:MFS superfamily sulfate permease-like transporter